MIDRFSGRYFFLSNFYPSDVEYGGFVYKNNEAAFQAQKDPSRQLEFASLNPSEAKKLGRRVTLRKDWEDVKVEIMKNIVREKFNQNPHLQEKLLATGDEMLIEGNTWNDCCWGVCNGRGKNLLGKILMNIRKELKTERGI